MTRRAAIALIAVVLLAGCGVDDVADDDAADTRRTTSQERERERPDDETPPQPGEPTLEPTDEGSEMSFGVIPTEWVSPPDLAGREAAVGLPDTDGQFLFMVSLRKARFTGSLAQLRQLMLDVLTSQEGLQPGLETHGPTGVFGLDRCEHIRVQLEVTDDDGRFPNGTILESDAWYCLEKDILYAVSSLEMAEPTEVISRDIQTLVRRAELDPAP